MNGNASIALIVQNMIKESGFSRDQVAVELGYENRNSLDKICNLENPRWGLRAELIPKLTETTGSDGLMQYLAKSCGGFFARHLEVDPADMDGSEVAHLAIETGECMDAIGRSVLAASDGGSEITPDETILIEREAHDVIVRATQIVMAMQKIRRENQ